MSDLSCCNNGFDSWIWIIIAIIIIFCLCGNNNNSNIFGGGCC